jgi:hypothetical protein
MKHCPFCLAGIPDEARKCMYCGEWVDEAHTPSSKHVTSVPEVPRPQKTATACARDDESLGATAGRSATYLLNDEFIVAARPRSILFVSIPHLSVGILVLVGTLSYAAEVADDVLNQQDAFHGETRGHGPDDFVNALLAWLVGSAICVVGWGLMRGYNWARLVGVLTSGLAMITALGLPLTWVDAASIHRKPFTYAALVGLMLIVACGGGVSIWLLLRQRARDWFDTAARLRAESRRGG